ncbi:MAG: hypothetical protein WAV95_08080 [Azonexus sp.]
MLKVVASFLLLICGFTHVVLAVPNCPESSIEVTIDTKPLVGRQLLKIPRHYPEDQQSAFAISGQAYGFDVAPASGAVSLAASVSLTLLHRKSIGLSVVESGQGGACVHRVVFNVRSTDMAIWEERNAYVFADFRKNEYMVDRDFFDKESSFRKIVGGNYSRRGVKLALNAGRKPVLFSEDELPRTDRGLLLEGARTQLLKNPEAPARQVIKLESGTYVLQMWGKGEVSVFGAFKGVARESEPLKFVLSVPGEIEVIPEEDKIGGAIGPSVRRFQLTKGGAPTSFIRSGRREEDRLDYGFRTANQKIDSFLVAFDLDLPAIGENHRVFIKPRIPDGSGVELAFTSDGLIEAELRINEKLVAKVSTSRYKNLFGKRGSRVAVGIRPGLSGKIYLYVDGQVVDQRDFSANFKVTNIFFWDSENKRNSLPIGVYLKKFAFLPYLEPEQVVGALGVDEWALPDTHALLADIPLIDPLVIDLEEIAADAVFPAINPKSGEMDFGISWSKSFPVPKRDVLIVGARTKVRQVRNIFGQRDNESAFEFPVKGQQRVDTDVINTQGVVWEIGGYKNTRSVFHNSLSGVRAGIHREMNPLPNEPADWRFVTRNDPHQTRLHWNARALYQGVHDYYIDLLTESVSGTVEGYHGDAGMQWQTASTDGKSSPIGTVAEYCGHFNIYFSTHYAGFYLPVQYMSRDQAINESGPLPVWLKLSRVQGKMLSEFRQYENSKPENIKISKGNLTSAFYHLDLSRGNQFGSYRPYSVYLKDFYVDPYPGRALLDHIRPINGKPIYQYISNARDVLFDVDGMADAAGDVSFPAITKIQGKIISGRPLKDFSSASHEYGPGPWYWPRFEGMIY